MPAMLKEGLSSCALILGAGEGRRMRPLTDTIPKPMVKLGGVALIDRVITRLQEAGVTSIVVNLHYLADTLEDHLKPRLSPRVFFSDERAQILDSGFGAKKMLPHVGGKPFLLANADTVWAGEAANARRLANAWDPAKMDILLLLADIKRSIGFDGRGDFTCDAEGRLTRRMPDASAPFAYAGFAILKPELFDDTPNAPFSLNKLFDRASAKGKLHGLPLEGIWMHVGTPQALAEAEALLASGV